MHNVIAQSTESTVVAEFSPLKKSSSSFESEAKLEQGFIDLLTGNGYEYLAITDDKALLLNLREQVSKLNNIEFSDYEWKQLSENYLIKKSDGIVEKTFKIHEGQSYNLKRDDGSTKKNIRLIDKQNIHRNKVQVISQYEAKGTRKNRYDVTLLVNGLPMVHVELKKRGISIKEAFNQINRYQQDSFWADSGLFQFVQLFVISNGTHTKYYSNTARDAHIQHSTSRKSKKKTSHSFEFTSWWTDTKNNRIADLVDFSKTFLTKHTLLAVLTKYCVFTDEKLLLVMRPYQIAATEKIMNRIAMASNHKHQGTKNSGGYVWHTTGSGKTLTSFKAAQLASQLDMIDKVIFVVDRKDLDYQTMREYDKFQKGAANSNASTKILTQQLENSSKKIIVTTLQKMSRFIESHKDHAIYDDDVVFIFDECHRSQFGSMHTAITDNFQNYHLFGFTGTPIFAKNASTSLKTTEKAFGIKLHSYTIVDAINDRNVLPFRIDYINTIKMKEKTQDKKVKSIHTDPVLKAPERINKVTDYLLDQFDRKTMRDGSANYDLTKLTNITETVSAKGFQGIKQFEGNRQNTRARGFNSIFAVGDIELAKLYYQSFKNKRTNLKVATIFSYNPNEEDHDSGLLAEENFTTNSLDHSSRDFLETAIQDYNQYFGTSFDTSSEKFENYYKDISERMKKNEIDLLIVVNMFLTGFDATTLNTLWVDKNLRHHGLLQAFSRTNRILNSKKTYGNIVSFRNLDEETKAALSIFGDKKASGIVLLKTFNEYYHGWNEDGKHHKGYIQLFAELNERFPLPLDIVGEQNKKDFIRLWGTIMKMLNILRSFDEFDLAKEFDQRQGQDYQSVYLDLYDELRPYLNGEKENIIEDVEFEIELIKEITVNIDYILRLVAEFHASNINDREMLKNIDKAIDSSFELRSKKELIKRFIDSLNQQSDIDTDWPVFTEQSKKEELDEIIKELDLQPDKTQIFINKAFQDQEIKSTGTALAELLPSISRFSKSKKNEKNWDKTKKTVFNRLKIFFEKYLGL